MKTTTKQYVREKTNVKLAVNNIFIVSYRRRRVGLKLSLIPSTKGRSFQLQVKIHDVNQSFAADQKTYKLLQD